MSRVGTDLFISIGGEGVVIFEWERLIIGGVEGFSSGKP